MHVDAVQEMQKYVMGMKGHVSEHSRDVHGRFTIYREAYLSPNYSDIQLEFSEFLFEILVVFQTTHVSFSFQQKAVIF